MPALQWVWSPAHLCVGAASVNLRGDDLIEHHQPRTAPALITLYRKSIEQRGLLVADGPPEAIIFGWRFGPRVRRRLGLGSKYSLRCDVGHRCWRGGALASDHHRRTRLQRCIRNEQQCYQRQTYHCQKAKSWYCRVVTHWNIRFRGGAGQSVSGDSRRFGVPRLLKPYDAGSNASPKI